MNVKLDTLVFKMTISNFILDFTKFRTEFRRLKITITPQDWYSIRLVTKHIGKFVY